jgi:hypothetical protein
MGNFHELLEIRQYFQGCQNLRKTQSVIKFTKGFIIERNLQISWKCAKAEHFPELREHG